LSYGLIYLHPVGNWTNISRIHWLGSPSQFEEVSPFVELDFGNISKAGYKSILFQTAIACLEPYLPYPDDFNYTILKQNVKWITNKAKDYGLEVYVLYYPDWRSEDYGAANIGYYYDEGSENWNLMKDFTCFLVQECME